MSQIKCHYEQVISQLEHGHEENIYVSGKLMEMKCSSATLGNYQRRADDLQTKYVS